MQTQITNGMSLSATIDSRNRGSAKQFRELGLRVFFDEDSILPGDDIVVSIERGLQNSRHVVFVITPSSCSSGWVAMETAVSIFSDPDAGGRKLIPVLLEPTPDEQIRPAVRRLKWVDLTQEDQRVQNFHQLLQVLGVERSRFQGPPA